MIAHLARPYSFPALPLARYAIAEYERNRRGLIRGITIGFPIALALWAAIGLGVLLLVLTWTCGASIPRATSAGRFRRVSPPDLRPKPPAGVPFPEGFGLSCGAATDDLGITAGTATAEGIRRLRFRFAAVPADFS